jgi:2,3-bisphosphoglycerate-dependent phosphoglycerate mutase
MSGKLYLVRHGQSEWNKQNLFTGWVDIPLSQEGIAEALKVGDILKNINFDVVFTSNLIRAEMTAMLLLMKNKWQKVPYRVHEQGGDFYQIHDQAILEKMLPIYQSPTLNERMYGKLQGMNKDVARKNYGEEQVQLWRRSYDLSPPSGESLEMTKKRCLPYFESHILPYVKKGQTVLIVAHGNSLRSIIMELRQMTKEQILHYELATGEPVFFEWENHRWNLKTLV